MLVFSELLFFAMQNITIFNAQFWFRYENAKFIAHSTFEDEKNPNFFVHYRDNLLRKPSTLSELHRIFVKIKYYSFSYSCCWSSTWINNLMMEFKFVIQPHFEMTNAIPIPHWESISSALELVSAPKFPLIYVLIIFISGNYKRCLYCRLGMSTKTVAVESK